MCIRDSREHERTLPIGFDRSGRKQVFQPNDPRFWKAILGVVSLTLSCTLAWLMLQL